MRKPQLIVILSAAALAACFVFQQRGTAQAADSSVARPPIVGVAHIGLFVSDLAKAEEFYGHQLGFAHFSLDKPTGGLMLNYYKVNDHQYIEIYPGLKGDSQDRLSHVAFETKPASEGPATGCSYILVTPDGERTMNTYLGAAQDLMPGDIDPAQIAASAMVYLEGYLWDPKNAKEA